MDGPTTSDAQQRPGRDAGSTFIEVVVTIVLMGLVVVPILAAVRTSIRVSTVSEVAAEVETVLVNAVDRVSRAPRLDFDCDLSEPAKAAAETHGWSGDEVVVRQRYWTGTEWSPWVAAASATCPSDPNLVQSIELTVTDPDDQVTRTLEVVKGANS